MSIATTKSSNVVSTGATKPVIMNDDIRSPGIVSRPIKISAISHSSVLNPPKSIASIVVSQLPVSPKLMTRSEQMTSGACFSLTIKLKKQESIFPASSVTLIPMEVVSFGKN